MAAEAEAEAEAVAKQQQNQEAAAERCADGGCRPCSGAPMCAWCYAEKIVKPKKRLEALLAQIKKVPQAASDGQPPRFREPAGLSFRRSTQDCS